MKTIVNFNINGIRAALKKDFLRWVDAVDPDVLMLQEIKAKKDQLDLRAFEDRGFHVELNSADKPGYSGVAVLSKELPKKVRCGIGVEKFDIEGRSLFIEFEKYSVCSVYMPSGASNALRQAYKLEWLTEFNHYLSDLLTVAPDLIIAGDFNICHNPIDIHNPVRLKGVPGFTHQERRWMNELVEMGFVDAFRRFNSEPENYTWWSYMARSRERNIGWRIDYQFYSESIAAKLSRAIHLTDVRISDHCPVLTQLDI